MKIDQEMIISHNEGQTSYKAKINSFKRLNTWKPGWRICSKLFKVDGVNLRIDVYPNGRCQDDVNLVSFYIVNKSDVAIDLLCDINIGSKIKLDDENVYIKPDYGWKKCYNHKDVKDNDDVDFEIAVPIKRLRRQVQEDSDNDNVVDNSLRTSGGAASSIQKMTYPECPICLEDMIQDAGFQLLSEC